MGTRYLTFPRSERIAEVATFSAHVGHKFIHSGMGSPESTLNITADPLPPDESYSLMLTVGVQFGSPMEDDVVAQVKRAGAAKILGIAGIEGGTDGKPLGAPGSVIQEKTSVPSEAAHTTPKVKPVADSGSSMSNNYRVDYIPASTSTATRVYTYIVADPAQQVVVSTQTTEEVCGSNGFLGAEIYLQPRRRIVM